MRFPMTMDRFTRGLSVVAFSVLGLMVPFQLLVVLKHAPPPIRFGVTTLLVGTAGLTLVFTVALAPRAARVTSTQLVVERLLWPPFEVPLRNITGLEEAPPLSLLHGRVRRVAGNGGMLGYTGLFHVTDVGLVRCWATRLDAPTVLVRRGSDRPLLLGVDDPEGLLKALKGATSYSGRS